VRRITESAWLRRGLTLVGLAVMAFAVWSAWERQEAIRDWATGAGPVPFFLVMALLPAIGVPITPLFVLAGVTFGRGVGLVGSLAALGLNLALCYQIARSGIRPRIEGLMRRFDFKLPDYSAKETSPIPFVLAVKFAPGVPAFVKHYGLGVAGVPFLVYFGLSMLITGAYGALLVLVGQSLLQHSVDRNVIIAGVAVLLLLVLGVFVRRRNRPAPG
jgi:uncharacterized membrane protein YdjX (TVP38/TMEM64 family)